MLSLLSQGCSDGATLYNEVILHKLLGFAVMLPTKANYNVMHTNTLDVNGNAT